jgi:hypothetical protein
MKSWLLKIHLWLGLYFLIFLWLFSASGLLLNHHWDFAEFWTNRKQSSAQHLLTPLTTQSDLDRAHEVMRQLNLAGEVEWTASRPTDQRIDFRVARPGRNVEVKADLAGLTASVQDVRLNGWGILRALHTFNGAAANANRAERDWNLTKLWTFAMDALAAGLVALVITSVLLAWERRDRRRGALLAFVGGCAVCGFFVVGL